MVASNAQAATVAAGAALGSSPPSPTISGTVTDERALIGFGTGTSPATGAAVTVTLSGNYANVVNDITAPIVTLTARNQATAALGLYVSAVTGNTFTVACTVAPAASQGASTYQFGYQVTL
jgi:hypothetical protein